MTLPSAYYEVKFRKKYLGAHQIYSTSDKGGLARANKQACCITLRS